MIYHFKVVHDRFLKDQYSPENFAANIDDSETFFNVRNAW